VVGVRQRVHNYPKSSGWKMGWLDKRRLELKRKEACWLTRTRKIFQVDPTKWLFKGLEEYAAN